MSTKLVRTTIRLPGDTYAKLKKLRKRTGIPITNLVRLAVTLWAQDYRRQHGRIRRLKRGAS